jgi:hypothetical protein
MSSRGLNIRLIEILYRTFATLRCERSFTFADVRRRSRDIRWRSQINFFTLNSHYILKLLINYDSSWKIDPKYWKNVEILNEKIFSIFFHGLPFLSFFIFSNFFNKILNFYPILVLNIYLESSWSPLHD